MLKDNFYTIIDFRKEENIVHAEIELNEQHEIFKGHFPNQPVVPGVCWMQIAKEILTYSLNKKLFLNHADDIKFLKMHNPNEQKNMEVKINYSLEKNDIINANIIFQKEDTIYCKIRCSLSFSE
ncbi:MAG: 3-hydroxyacyl-ACP dehydratase [Arachidicoccus sp.]|nr:3-hydroxyacyl-ACP dehydratase [Arachidicoccus sp.]